MKDEREKMAKALFCADWPKDKWERFKDGDHAKERYLRLADAAILEFKSWGSK